MRTFFLLLMIWAAALAAEPAPLPPVDGATVSAYGRAVALAGDIAAVAAEGGVWLFVRDFPAPGQWGQVAHLAPPPEAPADFGASLALVGSRLAVGAPGRGDQPGAVYLYRRGPEGWRRQRTLTGSGPGGRFGAAVALNDTWLAVGAYREPVGEAADSGTVHLFHCPADGDCTEAAVLTDPFPERWEEYGAAVALSDTWLAVGAPAKDSVQSGDAVVPLAGRRGQAFAIAKGDAPFCGADTGAVFLYRLDDPGIVAAIAPEDAECLQSFGAVLALTDAWLAIGSPTKDVGDALMAGAVYLYRPAAEGWEFAYQLVPDVPDEGGAFGGALAWGVDRLAIGAEGESGARFRSGRVHLIGFDAGVPYLIEEIHLDAGLPNDRFGAVVALDGDGPLLVGAPGRRGGNAFLHGDGIAAGPVGRFDVAGGRLTLESVGVVGDAQRYRAVLVREDTSTAMGFRLQSLETRSLPERRAAWFFPTTGLLHLPHVTVRFADGREFDYSATLRLLPGSDPLAFQLESAR